MARGPGRVFKLPQLVWAELGHQAIFDAFCALKGASGESSFSACLRNKYRGQQLTMEKIL